MACVLLSSSAVRVPDSQAYRKMDVTRERIAYRKMNVTRMCISRTYDTTDAIDAPSSLAHANVSLLASRRSNTGLSQSATFLPQVFIFPLHDFASYRIRFQKKFYQSVRPLPYRVP